jgi:hypothetical protein
MRIQALHSRPPGEIPVAGVTLRDLMIEPVSIEDAQRTVGPGNRADIREGDEIWRFRTPA